MKRYALFLIAFSSIFLVLLSGCLQGPGQNNQSTNTTNATHEYKIYGDPTAFFATISKSRNFSLIMDITNATGDERQVVFACGAGVARSWAAIEGKNISFMKNYVIEGNDCTKGTPGINETTTTTSEDCINSYSQAPYVYVSYGPSESYFSNSSWKIIVDRAYIENSECGFKPSG